jgi:PAB-dependent poly(A)-specific ribonuclease subunit 3
MTDLDSASAAPGADAVERASLVQHTPVMRTWRGCFMPDDAEAYFHRLGVENTRSLPPDDPRVRDLPSEFVQVWPLDEASKPAGITGSTGYPSRVYKAVRLADGVAFAVRRVDNIKVPVDVLRAVFSRWTAAGAVSSHPNIVALRFCPTTQKGERATLFAHDFVTGARNLQQLFFSGGRSPPPITEGLLWRVTTDVLLALRAVHSAGLSMHGVSAERVLIAPDGRALLSGAGVLEALDHDSDWPIASLQASDLRGLGEALVQLICGARVATQPVNLAKSVQFVASRVSPRLVRLLHALLGATPPPAARLLEELVAPQTPYLYESLLRRTEALEQLLMLEAGSGRMLRLMVKLMHVLDRPESETDRSWGASGDKAALAAMRDVIFHQVDDSGRPRLDPSHVVECLQKLDCGDPERVLLPARDGQSLMMADWGTLRGLLQESFMSLAQATEGAMPPLEGSLRVGVQAASGRRLGVAGAQDLSSVAPAGLFPGLGGESHESLSAPRGGDFVHFAPAPDGTLPTDGSEAYGSYMLPAMVDRTPSLSASAQEFVPPEVDMHAASASRAALSADAAPFQP